MPRQTFSFDGGNEGWRLFNNDDDSFLGSALFNNLFGGAQSADNETGTSPFLATPASFGGDNSELIGGSVTLSYRNADALCRHGAA